VIDFIKGAVILAVTFLFIVFLNCVFWETVRANSYINPPPQKFQWEAGKECSCGVLRAYASYFIPSSLPD
jgi:hypothetical protein